MNFSTTQRDDFSRRGAACCARCGVTRIAATFAGADSKPNLKFSFAYDASAQLVGASPRNSAGRSMLRPYRITNSSWLSFLPAIFFAGVLALAPQPAFAQHGGGGGGGHSGGGGGGSHSSGGGHISGGSHASVSHGSGAASGSAVHSYGGGTYRSSLSASDAAIANHNAVTNRWVDPPSRGSNSSRSMAPSARPVFTPASRSMAGHRRIGPFETFAPDSLQIFGRRRFFGNPFFFGGSCFNGFFIGPCGFGPGFGFGFGFGSGFFGPWGWDNDGFNDFQSYGYPYEPSMSADIEARVDNQPTYEDAAPYYRNEFVPYEPGTEPSGPAAAPNAPFVMLYLNDGTVYALTNYWVAGGRLHYVTQYGGENSVAMDQVDMQRTVDVNAHRGMTITLRPRDENAPAPTAPKEPAPQP
jgi:hypothetical protein